MKVVLDTNVLLVSISPKSKYHWIFQKFINEDFTLCVTTDILQEYEEIIGQHMGQEAANHRNPFFWFLVCLIGIIPWWRRGYSALVHCSTA